MAKEKELKAEPLEKQLWKAADKVRKNIDAAECYCKKNTSAVWLSARYGNSCYGDCA